MDSLGKLRYAVRLRAFENFPFEPTLSIRSIPQISLEEVDVVITIADEVFTPYLPLGFPSTSIVFISDDFMFSISSIFSTLRPLR